jgi:hypothetical protein
MVLSYKETEDYLNLVFSSVFYKYIEFGTKRKLVFFKHPSSVIKQKANLVYKNSYDKAIDEGILPIKDLEELIIKRNIFTEEDVKNLNKLKSQLEAQQILLGKTTRIKAKVDRLKNIVKRLERDINELLYKKSSKLLMSAETKAEEEKATYICCKRSYFDNEQLIWSSYQDMLKETNIVFRDEILTSFLIFYRGLDTGIIRELARSSIWRIRYITSMKVSEDLFGVPTSEYTTDQVNLVYWSNFYQGVYELGPEDRPSDLIIEDDDALDIFMTAHYKERNQEDAARRSKKTSGGKLSAFNSEEVIVTSSNDLYQDINYDRPREAQRVKDRVDIKKRTTRRK